MAKTAKKLKYINGELPEDIGALLANADENDLKILIALMMAADESGAIPEKFSVSEALGLEKSDVAASVKFWRGAGAIEGGAPRAKKEPAEPKTEKSEKSEKTESAHRGGVVESSNDLGSYKSAELASLLEDRRVSAEFIDEAQRVFGKTFNSYDTGIVVGLIDRLGLDEEAVLTILAYVKRSGKSGLRYAEKVAIGLYDEGYTTAKDISTRIDEIEKAKEKVYQIKQLFGMGSRALSSAEKKMFESWIQKLGYDMEVIKLAYDITVDVKHEALPKYANAILENWYTSGLRTARDVEEHEKKKKEGKATEGKSYDLDEFYEAALKRTFEDMK